MQSDLLSFAAMYGYYDESSAFQRRRCLVLEYMAGESLKDVLGDTFAKVFPLPQNHLQKEDS